MGNVSLFIPPRATISVEVNSLNGEREMNPDAHKDNGEMTQQHRFLYRPVMWSRDGVVMKETNPAIRYEVLNERGDKVGYITNLRASGRTPCWEISRLNSNGRITELTGEYATVEDALSEFKKELSS